MSQGDYIRYKRVAQELKVQTKLPAVLDSGKYTNYKEFSIENTVVNDITTYDRVIPTNTRIVFGMERPHATSCPTFDVCNKTDDRSNRKEAPYSQLQPASLTNIVLKKMGALQFDNAHCKCVN